TPRRQIQIRAPLSHNGMSIGCHAALPLTNNHFFLIANACKGVVLAWREMYELEVSHLTPSRHSSITLADLRHLVYLSVLFTKPSTGCSQRVLDLTPCYHPLL